MKKIGAFFLCFVVIICVFRANDFSLEEYLNYVEENAPKYKPQFFKNPDGEKVLTYAGSVMVGNALLYYADLYGLPNAYWPTVRDYVTSNNLVFMEKYIYWPTGEIPSPAWFISDAYYGRAYFEFGSLDANPYSTVPSYAYETILNEGPQTVGEYLDYIYNFIKGILTVPVWLLHWIGVLSYGAFAS